MRDVKSKETKKVIKDLKDTIKNHELIGLAANQIGSDLRIFVTQIRSTKYRKLKEDKLRVYINPKIIWKSKKQVFIHESCGSVAYTQLFAPVKRPEKIEIEALDENGEKFRMKADGILARVIQHEIDHLDGRTFLDRVQNSKSFMSSEEYQKKIRAKYKK